MTLQYNMGSVIITTAVPSSPPQNVTVVSVDPASLMVTWQPPPLIDHNGPLTEYAITYQRIGYLDVMNVSVIVTDFKISGLSPFVNYSVSIAAINTDGIGVFSTIISQLSGQDGKYEQKTFIIIHLCWQ